MFILLHAVCIPCFAKETYKQIISPEVQKMVEQIRQSKNNGTYTFSGALTRDDIWEISDAVKSLHNTKILITLDLASCTMENKIQGLFGNFRECSNLLKVILPNGLTFLSNSAFSDCENLTSITIPSSCHYIDSGTLRGCKKLTSIHIDSNNPVYTMRDGFIYKPKTHTIVFYPSAEGIVTVPDDILEIGDGAFCGTPITSIKLPPHLERIGSYAFSSCTSLSSITLPDSLLYLGEAAFSKCTSLTSITIPKNVPYLENYLLSSCSSLTDITFANGSKQTEIMQGVFTNCTSLSSLKLPDTVSYIGLNAFDHCTSLASMTLPRSLKILCAYAFYHCNSLQKVVFPPRTDFIGPYLFSNCYSLTDVTLPAQSDKGLSHNDFDTCISLKTITIPQGIKDIGEDAFINCYQLASIRFESPTPPVFHDLQFTNTPVETVLIPGRTKKAYEKTIKNCLPDATITEEGK